MLEKMTVLLTATGKQGEGPGLKPSHWPHTRGMEYPYLGLSEVLPHPHP